MITADHPNPLPQDGDIGTMDGLATFILNNPNYAWRNVVTVDRGVPTFTHTFTIDTTPAGTAGTYIIGLSYKNLTIGSQVAFSCGTPIASGPDQGKVLQLTQTAVTQNSGSLGTSFLTLPAGFKGEVSYSYFAQAPILGDWSVEFFALLEVPLTATELFDKATPLAHFGAAMQSDHPVFQQSGPGGMQGRAVKVGSCSTQGRS